jgi:hypothetical protein
VTGGTAPYTWSVAGGLDPLPSIDADTGLITLDDVPVAGSTDVVVTVRDANGVEATLVGDVGTVPLAVLDKHARLKETLVVGAAQATRVRALELVQGSTLSATVKFAKTARPPVALRVEQNDGAPVDLTGHLKPSFKSLKLTGLPIERSGRYFLVIELAEGVDEVATKLSIVVRPPSSASGTTSTGDPVSVTALPGARLSIRGKLAKDETGRPTILSVKDSDGLEWLDPKLLRIRGRVVTAALVAPPSGPEYVIRFATLEGTPAQFAWKVIAHGPKGYPFALDDLPTGVIR